MATQIGQLGVTFPDNTLQTTAAIAGAPGFGGFTNMSVYTTTSFWVVPAGITKCKVTVVGGGGGSSYAFVGTGGGTSSFGAFCSATGGTVGFQNTGGTGGIGVSGTLNIQGNYATGGSPGGGDGFSLDLGGGSSIFGNASYGAGASGFFQNAGPPNVASGGGAGGTAIRIVTGLTAGTSISITVGAAGGGNVGTGYAGVVILEY